MRINLWEIRGNFVRNLEKLWKICGKMKEICNKFEGNLATGKVFGKLKKKNCDRFEKILCKI